MDDSSTDSDGSNTSMEYPYLSQSIHRHAETAEPVSSTSVSTSTIQDGIDGLITNASKGKASTKVHFCIFCGIGQTRLERHLLAKHKDEKNLVAYLNASKQDKKKELEKLRYGGDYQHNKKVLEEKSGTLVVRRRKRQAVSCDNFTHCPFCFGYFQTKDLYRHKCERKDTGTRRDLVKKGRLLIPEDANDLQEQDGKLREIFGSMQGDRVSLAAKNDPLIRCIGRKEAKKNAFDRDRHNQIRNKLREMGRLLLKVREISKQENGQLKDFITPAGFQLIVDATKQVAGYDDETCEFQTPTLAVKIGHTIKLCADILEAQAIEQNDEVLETAAKGYLKLHTLRWQEEISAHAYRSLYRKKKGKVKRIPLSKDVATLAKYLKDKAEDALERLQKSEEITDKETWIELAELTLTQIILFNRRRQGEASKMTLDDFRNQQHTQDSDVVNSLSDFEKKLCEVLTRVEIYGKRGRIVPVLLTASMKQAVECLLKYREEAGVSSTNKFIFACTRYNSDGHIRGSDTLRKFVQAAKLEHPEYITSTGLRKQVATLSQILNLKDNELDLLAQYMGHDVRVHREHYRLPSDLMQLAKVSKLLQALEKGLLPRNKGRNLDEIHIGEDEECSSDEEPGS